MQVDLTIIGSSIQPVLAARDEKVAVKASFITAAVVAPFGFFTVFMGMYARVFFPTLDDLGGFSTNALPYLMMNKMTPIIGGIVLASIFAAILSTVSPIILAAGTMFTKDIYQKYINPDAPDKKIVFISRVATAIAGIGCIVLAVLLNGSKVLDIVYLAYTFRGALFIILLYSSMSIGTNVIAGQKERGRRGNHTESAEGKGELRLLARLR